MVKINWEEYKEFKNYSNKNDNFELLLDFIKSFYNIHNTTDIYDILMSDELASMMLNKRNIADAEDLEKYIFKR